MEIITDDPASRQSEPGAVEEEARELAEEIGQAYVADCSYPACFEATKSIIAAAMRKREEDAYRRGYHDGQLPEAILSLSRAKVEASEGLHGLLQDIDNALGGIYWTTDDGSATRNGTPNDEEIPEYVRQPWIRLRALLARAGRGRETK